MAKKLERPQPSSSIANVLDMDAARAAIGQPSRHQLVSTNPEPQAATSPRPVAPILAPAPVAPILASAVSPQAPSTAPTGEPATALRQFQLTPTTDRILNRLMAAYSEATGLKISGSELLRAMLYGMEPAIELHEREAKQMGLLKRSKNDPWLLHKRDELEKKLARAFVSAMRAAPTLE